MDQILNQLQSSVSLQYTVMASLGFASTKLMIKVNKHIHWQEKKMPTEKNKCVGRKLFRSERKRMLPKVLRNLLFNNFCFVFNGFKRGFLQTVFTSTSRTKLHNIL